jgi:NACHT domain
VLWIKGKPGVGKSTLVKHAMLYCQETFRDHIIVAYFFNARGNELQKTSLGMLRSLLYQLLEKDPILYEKFIRIYLDKENKHGSGWEWRFGELQSFLLYEVKKPRLQPLILLIDALDECNESEVQEAVTFLESLSIMAVVAKKLSSYLSL